MSKNKHNRSFRPQHTKGELLPIVACLLLIFACIGYIVTQISFPFIKHTKQPSVTAISAPPITQSPATKPENTTAKVALNPNYGLALSNTLPSLSASNLNHELVDITSLGVGWIRVDLSWADIQPKDSQHYNWASFDRTVNFASTKGLSVLPIIAYTPEWARLPQCKNSEKCAPANNSQFRDFAVAAVNRYKSKGISTWEIWNEPNLQSFWEPTPDPSKYSQMLKLVSTGIKSADPLATVLSGSTGSLDDKPGSIEQISFLRQMYASGAKNYFDAVGYHPYSFPVLPSNRQLWNGWSKMAALPISLRTVMNQNGDQSKKIWITEFGAPTNGPGALATSSRFNLGSSPDHVSEELQASIFRDAATLVQGDSSYGPLFWYSYKDSGTSANTNENFFGILRYDGSQKPAYAAVKSSSAASQ